MSAPARALPVAARELLAERAHPDGIAAALTVTGMLALPGGRDAIFAGKALALFLLMLVVGIAAGAFSIFLLDLDIALPGHLAFVTLLGLVALAPVMIVNNVVALRVRARVALVPILSFPMLVPQLVAASQGSAAALAGDASVALSWGALLLAFAFVYAVLGLTIVPAAID